MLHIADFTSFYEMFCEWLEGLVYISVIVPAFGFIWVTTPTQLVDNASVNFLVLMIKASFQLIFDKMLLKIYEMTNISEKWNKSKITTYKYIYMYSQLFGGIAMDLH